MSSINNGVDRVARRISNELLDDRYKNKFPRGFVDRTKSTLSYTAGTRTLEFTPAADNITYVNGFKLNTLTTQSVVHANTIGIHYFVLGSDGIITTSMTPWDLFTDQPVAMVYWNGITGWMADERHGGMQAQVHSYLHNTVGARWASGLQVQGTVTPSGAPTLDSQSQVNITAGRFYDEDIRNDIDALSNIPMLYFDGTGAWARATPTAWPFTVGANNRPHYQNPAGGLLQASNNRYVVYWLFATNFDGLELVSIPHPAQFTTEALAQASAISDLALGTLPTPEMVALGRMIVETRDTYTTPTRKAVTRRLDDYRRSSGPVAQSPTPVSHSTLAGLSADDHPQYVLHGESRQSFVATTGQTVFDLSFTYTPGADELLVFVNGVLQVVTTDYTETDSDTITFTSGLPVGTKVRIIRL